MYTFRITCISLELYGKGSLVVGSSWLDLELFCSIWMLCSIVILYICSCVLAYISIFNNWIRKSNKHRTICDDLIFEPPPNIHSHTHTYVHTILLYISRFPSISLDFEPKTTLFDTHFTIINILYIFSSFQLFSNFFKLRTKLVLHLHVSSVYIRFL